MRYLLATTATVAALFALPASAATFSGNTVDLVGSAVVLGNGDLQLNSDYGQAGAAWLDGSVSTASSFSSTFSFSLANTAGGQMADGIAFAMQNQGTGALGYAGGYIGYTGMNAVGSVVQSWYNNTAGLNTDGNSYDTAAAPANLGAAQLVLGTETVSYNASTHLLSMTGSLNVDNTIYALNDSATIDLGAKFGPQMVIGFTGGTGGSKADQRITDFSVSAVPEADGYAMLLAGLGLVGFMARRRKSA